MSVVLLIDGYNVIPPIAPPGRQAPGRQALGSYNSMRHVEKPSGSKSWLMVEREKLLHHLAQTLDDSIKKRTCVVFDAKNSPANQPDSFAHDGILVRFAIDHPEADDLLEEIIRQHHHPKHLTVVSSDRRIQAAAKRRRARFFDSDPWYDALLDGKVRLGWKPKKPSRAEPKSQATLTPVTPPIQPSNPWDISDEELQRFLDGPNLDGPNLDGPNLDGPDLDGPNSDGPIQD